jgi:predicted amidohydrolase
VSRVREESIIVSLLSWGEAVAVRERVPATASRSALGRLHREEQRRRSADTSDRHPSLADRRRPAVWHDLGMRVLLAAITCQKGDIEGNLVRHRQVLREAARAGCDLAVFPELSLTGSVDAVRHPERAIGLDDPAVHRMAEAAHEARVGALFGLAEVRDGDCHITQAYASDGRVAGVQRKRHLGDDEHGFVVASETTVFEYGAARFGAIICAEAGVDATWDATAATGAAVLFMCSAPGLDGRRTTEARWRDGFEWWEACGLGDARRHAARLGVWVALATQAGSTADEDFPGIAALVAPTGEVRRRLPDWRPGTLVVDIPVATDVEPVRWSIRVLIVDEDGRTLLVQFCDAPSGRCWWVPPGGGIEAGEDDLACARRELAEEIARDDLVVGPCIGRRGGSFVMSGRWMTQHERWYLCRTPHFDVSDDVVTRGRAEGIRDIRWWSSDELRAARIETGPRDLAELLDRVVAGDRCDPHADLGR